MGATVTWRWHSARHGLSNERGRAGIARSLRRGPGASDQLARRIAPVHPASFGSAAALVADAAGGAGRLRELALLGALGVRRQPIAAPARAGAGRAEPYRAGRVPRARGRL